ncbi:hypothetical protein C805_01180 [Eubacterium sp. 14-2]|uniref:hypothetical protein n=1 Tax=Eubacterium sp. 14-2 TaxID=1235790 RepID=UPI0003390FA1|nr:hypothetical protein [Eubacterium sp. 14-2]EOT27076.1 hypothetical protein C805_01180 [Eubacterium sp. 14-2]
MSRILKEIPYNQEQFSTIISNRNPEASTFLDAKKLSGPTVEEFLIDETKLKNYDSFGDYIRIDI